MIFKEESTFLCYIRDQFNKVEQNLFVVMRTGYSFKELLEADFTIEVAYLCPTLHEDDVQFFGIGDNFEGQQYFEVYDCYTDCDLLDKLLHTFSKEGSEDNTD